MRQAATAPVLLFRPAKDEVRFEALERLYRRRDAVEALIRSLEDYAEADGERAPCIPINAVRKCS